VAGSCEYGNDPSGSIKTGEFLVRQVVASVQALSEAADDNPERDLVTYKN
jgi:hypothetical protein